MLQRFLDPQVLASISSLDLVAKTVVDGFVAGLHRSPTFGFSQEFAEYRQYVEGDDLRHVDWNVFARTERIYLKRFKGETNSQLLVLLDASASMTYGSANITKLDYARYMAASLVYLSSQQRDASGLIVFDEDIKSYVPPSTRQGQLMRLLHSIESAEGGMRTDFTKPFVHFQEYLRRRGIVVVLSDFYSDPEQIIKVIEPLRYRGNEVIMFHLLDPQEISPKFRDPVLLVDVEDDTAMEVSPEYARNEYREKMAQHRQKLSDKAAAAGLEYVFMDTSQPLDVGLRNYLSIRQRRR
ncbi:MAG: hypothetical protein QOJ99_84 [Bryobacterales bacterium]|jgi:uncharacterized protein (DUF58 family)|nr:hypothetical protein [Bryobacterales bacterium]